jgi:hypothetical protein
VTGTSDAIDRAALGKREWLTAHEAAIYVGATVDAVRDWLVLGIAIQDAKGRRRIALRGKKVGKRWKIRPADLDAFVKATTDASLSSHALPEDGKETPAEVRRRAARDKQMAAEYLGAN